MVHLRENGFEVIVKDLPDRDLSEIKTQYGIANQHRACHTAEVGGYFIEGHVPADVIAEMLSDQPDIRGLVLPGMPQGSPGMEGEQLGPLQILAYHATKDVSLYAER